MTFIVGVVMTFVWFSYGRLVNDHNIMTVNVTGRLRIGFLWSRNVGKKVTLGQEPASIVNYIGTGSSIEQPSQT